MSDTNQSGRLGHFLAACNHAASLIYHDVAAAEAAVANWRSDNPQLSAIFDQGTQYVEDLLGSYGVPVPQGILVFKTIGAALKQMAANDVSLATPVAGPAA